jgi:hypothetical protein
MGPVEYLLVAFPGNKFKGEIGPALADLVSRGTIRILDLVFVVKDEDGNIEGFELQDLPEQAAAFEEMTGETLELLNQEDVDIAAESLPANSSAALLVFENVWAEQLAIAVRNADGQLLANERIPAEVVEGALAALADES